jgi:RAQPRD family integrative conjugative element protein
MHQFQRSLYLLAAAGLACCALPALADGDGERAALARLVHEIEALEPIISEAEREADADARIRFQYDWLRVDLVRMRMAIQEHIEAPSAEPRSVPPLRGDYRR